MDKQDLIAITETIEKSFKIELTGNQLTLLLAKLSKKTYRDLEVTGADTMARDNMIDELSKKITGKIWPRYGDTAAVKKLHAQLLLKNKRKIKTLFGI